MRSHDYPLAPVTKAYLYAVQSAHLHNANIFSDTNTRGVVLGVSHRLSCPWSLAHPDIWSLGDRWPNLLPVLPVPAPQRGTSVDIGLWSVSQGLERHSQLVALARRMFWDKPVPLPPAPPHVAPGTAAMINGDTSVCGWLLMKGPHDQELHR